MKYNVGICLYGLPREIEICQKFNAPFFEKLNIQPYYFCHTWLTTDYKFIIGNFFGCINCKDMNKLNVSIILTILKIILNQ